MEGTGQRTAPRPGKPRDIRTCGTCSHMVATRRSVDVTESLQLPAPPRVSGVRKDWWCAAKGRPRISLLPAMRVPSSTVLVPCCTALPRLLLHCCLHCSFIATSDQHRLGTRVILLQRGKRANPRSACAEGVHAHPLEAAPKPGVRVDIPVREQTMSAGSGDPDVT